MELREWAQSILGANSIEGKLFCPLNFTDENPGPPLIWLEPERPLGMELRRRSKEEKLPPFQDHRDPDKRAICLHRFAGHELLAVEIMAYALLAFPEAPKSFRKGVAYTLKEEQGHVQLYIDRLKGFGVKFGDLPLYRHFWNHTPHMATPMHYISIMSLTFEMANLDFAPMYGKSFASFKDQESAQLMATIFKDEISHVRFGWQWLKRMKEPEMTEWDCWESILATTMLSTKRAKGFLLHEEPRRQAGIPEEWITKLRS